LKLNRNLFVLAAQFKIVEPFPANVYPVEFTSTQVTCVAYDASGVKVPDRIQFMRKDQWAEYTNITAGDNIFFTNRTEGKHNLNIETTMLNGIERWSTKVQYIFMCYHHRPLLFNSWTLFLLIIFFWF